MLFFSVQKNPETKELNILSHVFKITAKVIILNFRVIIIFHEQDVKKDIIDIRTSFFFINPLMCKWCCTRYTQIFIVEYDECFGFIFVYFVPFRHVFNENKS